MANREWKAEYKGHPIRVVNKFSLFPFATSEILEIDGAIIEHKEGGLFRLTSTMKATYNFDGQEQNSLKGQTDGAQTSSRDVKKRLAGVKSR